MSNTIDQRVVEMRFDNQQFERNVSTTMSTLDKLKQSLKFKDSAKGFENIDNAAKNVNMSALGNAVESVRLKFSALEVMGVTALANITNSAANAGKQMLSSLTIDQITAGWSKYEEKTASVQTIMNSTGKSIDEVNDYLNKLMWFSDETSYGFTDMTAALAQMTSSGGDIDKLIPLITGVANATAFAGKGANEFSRAMYNLNQSYGAGYLQYMDWRSLELAGVAGKDLKQVLIDTAVSMGKIAEGEVTLGNFSETLKDKWADTSVMEAAFGKFSELSEEAYKLVESGQYDTASEAIESLSGKYSDLAEKAFKSAQEAKSFTEAIDATKDAVSSGWLKTFEIIFGNYEEAKVLWTDLANTLWDIFASGGERRNELLSGALGKSFTSLTEKITNITKPAEKAIETITNTTEAISDLGDIVDKVILGDFGNGEDRFNALTEAGYNYYEVQNKVNEALGNSFRYEIDKNEAQSDSLKTQNETTEATSEEAKETEGLTEEKKALIKVLSHLSEEQLRSKGYTDEQIESINELKSTAEKLGIPLNDFIDNLDEINGRWILINSFKNIGRSILKIFESIGEAWREIFSPIQEDQLFNIIAGFHKLTTKLIISDENADKLKRTFAGLFAVIDVVRSVVGGAFGFAFKFVSKILENLNLNILDVTASIGDMLVSFRDWLFENSFISKAFDKLAKGVSKVIVKISEWVKAFIKLPAVQNTIEKFKETFTFDNIIATIESFINTVKEWINAFLELPVVSGIIDNFKSSFDGVSEIGKNLVDGLIEGLNDESNTLWDVLVNFASNIIQVIKDVLGINSPSTVMIAIGGFIVAGLVLGILNNIPAVSEATEGIVSKISEILGGIDFGKLFAGGLSAGMIVILNKFANAATNLTKPAEGLGDTLSGTGEILTSTAKVLKKSASGINKVLKSTSKVIKSFSKVLNAIAFSIRADALKDIAISLGILVASVALLSLLDIDKLQGAVGIILQLATILVLLAFAASKMSDASISIDKSGAKVQGLTTGFLGIAASILLLAFAVKAIGKMTPEEYDQGFKGLLAIAIGLLSFLTISSMVVKGDLANSIDKFGRMLTKLSVSLLILVVVAKLIAGMSWEDMGKAAVGLYGLVGIVSLLILATSVAGKDSDKIGSTLIKIAGAMAILVIVAKMIARMEWSEMGKAAVGLYGLVGVVALLILITRMAGKDATKIGSTILGIAASMAILVLVGKMISGMSWDDMGKSAAGLTGLVGIIALLVLVVKSAGSDAPKIGLTLLALSMSLAILAGIAVILSLVDLKGLAKGVIAVEMLGAIMALMIYATRGANDCKANLIVMTIAIGVMAAAIIALSFIEPSKMYGAAAALSILMGMFALIIKAGSDVKSSLSSLIVMTLAIVILAEVIYKLSELKVESVLSTVTSISILLLAMSACLFILKGIGSITKEAVYGIGALALMAVPLLAFVGVLAVMQGVKNATRNAMLLTSMAVVLTALLIPLSLIGALIYLTGGAILAGIGALALMAVPLFAFVGVLAVMQGIDNATSNAELLMSLMTAMADVLVKVSIVAPLAMLAVASLSSLMLLMTAIGALAIGVGKLMEEVSELEEFMDTGIPILEKLAFAVGSIAGNLISGFSTAVASCLPEIANQLTLFMDNLGGFIAGARNIDESVLTGVGILTGAIIALTAADLINGLVSFSPFGSSLGDLGLELSNFMKNASPFIAKAATIKPEMVEGIRALADTILILTAADILNGLSTFITGGSSLEDFGDQLGLLGSGLSKFSSNIGPLSRQEVDSINLAAEAVKTLAEVSSEIPNSGGLLGDIVGENDLGTFATQFPTLGKGIRGFIGAIGPLSSQEVDTIGLAADAVKTLAEASSEIPNSGGLLGDIVGNNDLATFADQFPNVGTGLRGFLNAIGEFTDAQGGIVESAAKAIKELASASQEIPNSGGLLGDIVGNNDLATFADQFPNVGTGLRGFLNEVGELSDSELNMIKIAAIVIKELASASQEIPNTGGILAGIVGDNDLSTFANQFPNVGTGLKGFVDNLGVFDKDTIATVKSGVSAIKAIAELSSVDLASAKVNISGFGAQLVTFGENLSEFLGNLAGVDGKAITDAVSNVKKVANMITDLENINETAGENFNNALKDIAESGFSEFVDAFTSATALENVKGAAEALINGFIEGVESKSSNIGDAFEEAAGSAADDIKTQANYEKFKSAGSYLVDGFAEGISSNTYKAEAQSRAMAQAAATAAKEALDINSPSKVFRNIAYSIPEGFAQGIDRRTGMVEDSITSMAMAAVNNTKNVISRIADFISSDVDTQPTIRPVLDLSDVKSRANSINSMLDLNGSVGLNANINAISSMMSNKNQNGVNDDVVSAINKLRKDLGNVGGNSYTINGVTYDDGSNVSNAVKTLVRAANIERRA